MDMREDQKERLIAAFEKIGVALKELSQDFAMKDFYDPNGP